LSAEIPKSRLKEGQFVTGAGGVADSQRTFKTYSQMAEKAFASDFPLDPPDIAIIGGTNTPPCRWLMAVSFQ